MLNNIIEKNFLEHKELQIKVKNLFGKQINLISNKIIKNLKSKKKNNVVR